MTESQTQSSSPALTEAARELQSAGHDAQVAFDCTLSANSTGPTPTR